MTGEDCVSRQAVIDAIHKQMYKFIEQFIDEQGETVDDRCDLILTMNKSITNAVRALPMVEPELKEPKTGHWVASLDSWGDYITTVLGYKCSECGCFNADKDNFCPNCGAKMEKEYEQ